MRPRAALLTQIAREAVADVEPGALLRPHADALRAHTAGQAMLVLAVGKAAPAMAAAIADVVGEVAAGSAIHTPAPGLAAPPGFARVRTGHPWPSADSLAAARAARAAVATTPPSTPVLVALSGGASAAWSDPVDGVSLDDLVTTQRLLMAAGVDIAALNTVRRHLSRLQGGRLALAARPRPLWTLALVDVVAGGPHDVGSGPTVGDPSSHRDALAVLAHSGVEAAVPESVRAHLRRGADGALEANPRPDDPRLDHARYTALATPALLRDRAVARARARGLNVDSGPRLLSESVDTVATALLDWARAAAPDTLRVLAGEPTLRLPAPPGRGGRAQHLALTAAWRLRELGRPWCVLALASDGVDGSGPAAGAVLDAQRLGTLGDDAIAGALQRADSGALLEALGAAITTGPTGTNLCDLVLLWVGAEVTP